MTGSGVADSGRDGASLRISGAQHVDIMQNNFAKSDGILVIHSVGAPETRIASNAFAATPAPRIEELIWNGPPRGQVTGNVVEGRPRSEEHTSELQSLMRISYAVFCLKKKKKKNDNNR